MYGRWEGELWFRRRHMWPVPSPSTPSLVAPINSCVFIDSNTFSKDGRKIHVGDCALFKPPHDSPPFVGIIRRLIVGKEDNLNLSVNWLYRPADVKLVKGASLEAAPNEVFYSFHQDEIPAASLLHPCKVAFLRKGVELPSRISSFVCRRVYDIESKRLWWLTDQDYINSYLIQERQEEVDQLLDKTRVEMYGALQAGGHSPKPLNGPNGTPQLKSSTDNIQNSSSIPLQVKSKKREHGVHSSDSVKRERLSKADDADSAQLRPEDTLKIEIAKITDKGGLVDFEGVLKLLRLMQPENAKKVDLACRIMLVDVISVTESFDCLNQFVQRRGLLVLDEWLQEVHKGKIGDGSAKGSDKSVEEFLFALLRALDRLPVNLFALQTCNVGKSVNHLRSHKNPEILKKARSLVDTWKKRVEAEMNIIETRSGTRRGGSWPNKSMMSEVSHMGSRRISGSSEGGAKISTSQPSVLKAQQGKHNSGEAVVKSPESPSSAKPLEPIAAGTGSSDVLPVTTKEEKSSSPSPSANNSQSCSSEHGKVGASCKEDAPSSTSGSISKISSGLSHSRKSSNVVHGSAAVPGAQKEGGLGNSLDRNYVSGKGSPIRATPERVADTSFAENINSQRLIVRLPSTGPSPARTASGGSVEDASTTFGKSSLVHSEKQDHLDRRTRGKGDAPPGNNVLAMSTNSCQGKEGLVGFDDVKKGTIIPCDEQGRDGEIAQRLTEASKATGSASGGTLKSAKSYEASYSSINALVESCAKFSEVNASAPVGDDVGMNLLASVAAGEISRSDASPAGSPENKRPLPEDTFPGNDVKSRKSIENGCQSEDNLKVTNGHVMMEQVSSVGYLPAQGGSQQQVLPAVNHISADGDTASLVDSSVVGLPQNGNSVLMAPEAKPAALAADASALLPSIESTDAGKEGDGVFQSHDGRKFSPNRLRSCHFPNLKPNNSSALSEEDKNAGSAFEKATENKIVLSDAAISAKVETQINDESASWSSSEKHEDEKKLMLKASSGSTILLQKEHSKGSELPTTSCGYVGLGPKAEEAEDKKMGSHAEQSGKANMDPDSSVLLQTGERAQESIDKKEVLVSGGSAPSDKSPVVVVQEDRTCLKQSDVAEGGISEQPASRGDFSTPVSETVVKLDFDLNEVLPSDDVIQGDVERPSIPGRFSAVHTPCSLPSASSLMTGNRPASITVAAAAKGPFISSENLLRGKPELGWKGSAATSAFRPAEPRKVIDVPVPDNKQARGFLDFDLNVGVVEDVGNSGPSGGGLDLDLNACEESPDVGHLSVGISRPAIPQLPSRSLLSGRFSSNLEPNSSSRDFDLNNGPGVEEIGGESIPLSRNGMQFLSAVPSMRMNNMEMGNFSWFPPNSTYPAITVLPGRGEQSYPMVPGAAAAAASQRMLSPAGTSFNPEIFRGPVLSSSPAVAFSSSTPFQFPGFPFETNFSVPSNTAAAYVGPSGGGGICFPTIPSGSYRPPSYVMSVGGNNVDNRKWGSQQQQQGQGGLDLNSSGPGGGGMMTDDSEQLKMFHQQMAGGLKRKEPLDGWDGDHHHRSSSYKHHHPSWQ